MKAAQHSRPALAASLEPVDIAERFDLPIPTMFHVFTIRFLGEHLPTVGELVVPLPINPPMGQVRRFPIQPQDLAALLGSNLSHVPDVRFTQDRHRHLPRRRVVDLRGRDAPGIPFSLQAQANVTHRWIPDRHHDGLALPDEVQKKILARHLCLGDISSAKKSGSATKRHGAMTRRARTPAWGWVWTKICPALSS